MVKLEFSPEVKVTGDRAPGLLSMVSLGDVQSVTVELTGLAVKLPSSETVTTEIQNVCMSISEPLKYQATTADTLAYRIRSWTPVHWRAPHGQDMRILDTID